MYLSIAEAKMLSDKEQGNFYYRNWTDEEKLKIFGERFLKKNPNPKTMYPEKVKIKATGQTGVLLDGFASNRLNEILLDKGGSVFSRDLDMFDRIDRNGKIIPPKFLD